MSEPTAQRIAMTVTGPVDAATLGVVMMHEHLLHGDELFEARPGPDGAALAEAPVTMDILGTLWRWPLANRANVQFTRDDGLADELARYRTAGGTTIVDMTNVGLSPDPEGALEIARRSDVQVVMGCGFFVDALLPAWVHGATVEPLTTHLVREITEGFGDTGVRPGIIGEVGTSPQITQSEQRSLRACARAAATTGLAVSVHLSHSVAPGASSHTADEPGFDALRLLTGEGLAADRVVCGHLDEARDADYAARLIDEGCYVAYDTFGTEWYWDNWKTWEPHDSQRVAEVAALCRRGLADRVVLSQDVAFKRHLHRYGGLGFDHLLVDIVPMLLDAGVSDTDVHTMLVENPRRLLTIDE